MTDRIKMEHYVPRFYLRNFSINANGKALYCFDKNTCKKFIGNVKNVACERYFYDIPKQGQSVERSFAKVEPLFNAVCSKLIATNDINSLKWDERVTLASFIAIQEIRTRETREWLKELCEKVKGKLSKHNLPKYLEKQLEEITTEEGNKELHLAMLKEVRNFVNAMFGMKWILIENKTRMLLWTSDHPINRYNPIEDRIGNLGFLSRGIQIFFPLTPRLGICLCDLVEYFRYPERMSTTDMDNIRFQNHLQTKWATRFIFSQDDDFSLAEEILREQPSLRNIARERVSVY